jgi:hypothetical protein
MTMEIQRLRTLSQIVKYYSNWYKITFFINFCRFLVMSWIYAVEWFWLSLARR